MTEKYRLVDLNSLVFPTPRKRAENTQETPLHPGDVVKALTGPATGQVGIVIVERNANYKDSEPNSGPETIGVLFTEKTDIAPELEAVIEELMGNTLISSVRWFDSLDQLEVLAKVEQD